MIIVNCQLWWFWWRLNDWNDRFTNCCSYCHDLDDDHHYHANDHNDCFDELRMILTLEGILHLSISRLTACRLPCSQDSPGWCPYLLLGLCPCLPSIHLQSLCPCLCPCCLNQRAHLNKYQAAVWDAWVLEAFLSTEQPKWVFSCFSWNFPFFL